MNTIEPVYISQLRECDINDPIAQQIRTDWFLDALEDDRFKDAYIIPETYLNKVIIKILGYKKLNKE